MRYVDGFVIPIPKKNVKAYKKMAAAAGKIWMKHGALQYCECVGQQMEIKGMLSFPRQIKAKKGETIVFSWILYKSRAHRDKVNAKVMKDPLIDKMMKNMSMPFDVKRMAYGGFSVLVDL